MRKLIFVIMFFSLSGIGCAPLGQESEADNTSLEETTPPAPEPGRDTLSRDEQERLRKSFVEVDYSANQQNQILSGYSQIDPKKEVPANLLKKALLFYDTNKDRISVTGYMTVIDFSQKSSRQRFYLIDMGTGAVETFQVAHGRGSDKNNDGYAETFKNSNGSHASSLGFYLTAETYYGAHGRSMRIDGLSSTNTEARDRDVVVHGADYVKDNGLKPGRSWGCPALSMKVKDQYIDRTMGGSLMYAGRSKVD